MSTPQPQPVTLHNTLGDTVPVVTDDQGNMRAAPPNGRLVVAAGQIISSAWGNTTYDQSFMTFASAADRTNQWPVPNEGALSFLMDSRTPWIYRAGAWRGLPLGFMNTATGPASQTDFTTNATVAAITFPVAAGRAYRISAYCYGTIQTTGSTGAAYRIRPNASTSTGADPADVVFSMIVPAPANAILTGTGVALVQPTTTGTGTARLMANVGGGGSNRIAANAGMILAEDIGG